MDTNSGVLRTSERSTSIVKDYWGQVIKAAWAQVSQWAKEFPKTTVHHVSSSWKYDSNRYIKQLAK